MKINKLGLMNIIICSSILTGLGYANTIKNPSVNIVNGYIGQDRTVRPTAGDIAFDIAPLSERNIRFDFIRLLGKNKSEIEATDKDLKSSMAQKYKKVKKKYRFLIYSDIYSGKEKGTEIKEKGIYILDENDICIGYAFFDTEYIYYKANDPEILGIKGLTKNSNYLKNELVTPPNKINFYEKDHGDYVEKYAINDEYFYMEAFYPKVLENNVKTRIKNILNFNYTHSFPTDIYQDPDSEVTNFSVNIEDDENNAPED